VTDSTAHESTQANVFVNSLSAKTSSPAMWRPGKLLAVIIIWISLAELTDILFLHQLTYSSDLLEALFDLLVLCLFLSPVYFIFYRPLKAHWLKENRTQQEIRKLNQKLLQAAEDERRKLALELHDHFGQMVTNLQCKAERIQRQVANNDVTAVQTCEYLMETISQLGHDIRGFTSELRPDMLDDLGLVETLSWYVKKQASEHPLLHFDFSAVGIKQRLPADIEITLYRVCQEALNNIVKHANANQVRVNLTYSHPLIILTIRDDGEGLPDPKRENPDENSGGLGLLGMRERLAAVGGSFELSSMPGEKTTVRAMIPVKGEVGSAWL
jgi:signal transduction histidine kinase